MSAMRDERPQTTSTGVMAPPRAGSCTPLLGRPQPPGRGLLHPEPGLPAPSLTGTLWGIVAVLAPCVLVLGMTIDPG